jgi:hypothetical protein
MEFSPLTVQGSFENGLILNKLWLIYELQKIQDQFSTIYILGSWYGNMSILLAKSQIQYNHIVNVDQDASVVRQAHRIARVMGLDDCIEPMVQDANRLDYRQLDQDGLVINTSCNDIENQGWFEHIPQGAVVALEGRDNQPNNPTNTTQDLDTFHAEYALEETYVLDKIQLKGYVDTYNRFLKIGIK